MGNIRPRRLKAETENYFVLSAVSGFLLSCLGKEGVQKEDTICVANDAIQLLQKIAMAKYGLTWWVLKDFTRFLELVKFYHVSVLLPTKANRFIYLQKYIIKDLMHKDT